MRKKFRRYRIEVIDKDSISINHRVLPKGRSFTANSGTMAEILPKGGSSIANSGTKIAVLLGMNRCGSFPLLSAPTLSLADLKRSEKIPGALTRG